MKPNFDDDARGLLLSKEREALLDALEVPIRDAIEAAGPAVHLITIAVHLEERGGFATASTLDSEHEAMRVLAQCVGFYALQNDLPGVTACVSEKPLGD